MEPPSEAGDFQLLARRSTYRAPARPEIWPDRLESLGARVRRSQGQPEPPPACLGLSARPASRRPFRPWVSPWACAHHIRSFSRTRKPLWRLCLPAKLASNQAGAERRAAAPPPDASIVRDAHGKTQGLVAGGRSFNQQLLGAAGELGIFSSPLSGWPGSAESGCPEDGSTCCSPMWNAVIDGCRLCRFGRTADADRGITLSMKRGGRKRCMVAG